VPFALGEDVRLLHGADVPDDRGRRTWLRQTSDAQ
jgi:hypothetical protein